MSIAADARVYAGVLEAGTRVEHALAPGRHAWVQVVRGFIKLNDVELKAGDGAAVSEERRLVIRAVEPSEILLFDLA